MTIDQAAADELLTTTRSVRKRLDLTRPVPPALIEECIEVALQAPTATNAQNWAFVVVTDADKKRAIAEHYRDGWATLRGMGYPPPLAEGDPREDVMPKVIESAEYLGAVLDQVPVLVIGCVQGRVVETPLLVLQASTYGSIAPAAWSFMLAARARGLGSSWTTLHLFHEREVGELLGIPEDWMQVVLLPVAYYTGDDFRPGHRLPATDLTHWNTWSGRRPS
jgi:nitroreductase